MLRKFSSTIFHFTCRRLHNSAPCYKLTDTKENDGVREIILNDQKTRNSLSMPMMTEILEEVNNNINDENLRIIILSSSLEKIFSAGHNLKELEAVDSQKRKEIFSKLTEIIFAIRAAPVPIIAKVNGLAAAAGCQLVTSCDLLVASTAASFSLPGADVGIFCSTPGVAVSRAVSRMKSSHMLFTGLPINANEANIAGMVSCVVPPEKLDQEIDRICISIKRKSRAVVELGKNFYYKQLNMNISDAFRAAEDVMVKNLSTKDGQEGIRSFIEKRKPQWTNS
ncbi:enoyl-CoA hydratase domain-containing protein 3, mitochondrial [Condylostylus longicornis]|uniref:enoyl-CoA hydratase domain-containing protein 3, mitochondrial n=1 Tax=Condylostylus longicornis TaxID=2530218 RepID=UPI00244DA862|nr:enoyl-CoA hydratase domain-containing protein 3, mitochondrial [Condylostylus longicornis]